MARKFISTNPDFIDVGTHAALDPSSLTISCWMNWDGSTTNVNEWVVGLDETSNRAYAFGVDTTNIRMQFVTAGTLVAVTSNGTVASKYWNHVAITGPGTDWTNYINGTAYVSGSTAAVGSSTADLFIGKRNLSGANEPFGGTLADVAIWNTVLTSGQITSLLSGVRPINVNSANLVGWWPLDGYASPEPDLSGNGFNGTLTGTSGVIGPGALWRLSA